MKNRRINNKKKKNIIIVGSDVPANWEFKKGLEKTSGKKWIVIKCITNDFTGIHKYTRYVKFFSTPFKLFLNRKHFDHILAWQQFFGLTLVFYLRLFRVKKYPKIDIMTFIYKPKKGIVGKIYERYIKYIVTSGIIRHIFVYGKSEVDYYSDLFNVSKKLFIAETLGIQDIRKQFVEIEKSSEKYYIAPGRSNRDYAFLRGIWPKDGSKLYIVSDMETSDLDTSNIVHLTHCFDEEYLKLLSNSYAVIVPLELDNLSSGQLVFLQAGMFGKPIITTSNNTVEDYISNGVNGIVIKKNAKSLYDALKALDDETHYNEISSNARSVFEQKYSLFGLGKRVGYKL